MRGVDTCLFLIKNNIIKAHTSWIILFCPVTMQRRDKAIKRQWKRSTSYTEGSMNLDIYLGLDIAQPQIYLFIVSVLLPFICGAQSPLLSWWRAMSSSSAVLWFRYRLGGTAHKTSWPLSCLPQIYRPSMTGRRAGTPIHRDNTHTHALPADIHTLAEA